MKKVAFLEKRLQIKKFTILLIMITVFFSSCIKKEKNKGLTEKKCKRIYSTIRNCYTEKKLATSKEDFVDSCKSDGIAQTKYEFFDKCTDKVDCNSHKKCVRKYKEKAVLNKCEFFIKKAKECNYTQIFAGKDADDCVKSSLEQEVHYSFLDCRKKQKCQDFKSCILQKRKEHHVVILRETDETITYERYLIFAHCANSEFYEPTGDSSLDNRFKTLCDNKRIKACSAFYKEHKDELKRFLYEVQLDKDSKTQQGLCQNLAYCQIKSDDTDNVYTKFQNLFNSLCK